MNINSFINHMSLGAALEPQQIKVLCNEAKTQRFNTTSGLKLSKENNEKFWS